MPVLSFSRNILDETESLIRNALRRAQGPKLPLIELVEMPVLSFSRNMLDKTLSLNLEDPSMSSGNEDL